MKKLVITESEKRRIRSLYEQVGGESTYNLLGNTINITFEKVIDKYGDFESFLQEVPMECENLLVTTPNGIFQNPYFNVESIDIPESIGKLTNLKSLMLEGFVKSLPESIGNLKDLNYLSIPYNKELKSLPESIASMPHLTVLNLKYGNPDINIPPTLQEKLIPDGDGLYYLENNN